MDEAEDWVSVIREMRYHEDAPSAATSTSCHAAARNASSTCWLRGPALREEAAEPLDGKNHFDCDELEPANQAFEVRGTQIAQGSPSMVVTNRLIFIFCDQNDLQSCNGKTLLNCLLPDVVKPSPTFPHAPPPRTHFTPSSAQSST
jgi:hypothetical protein